MISIVIATHLCEGGPDRGSNESVSITLTQRPTSVKELTQKSLDVLCCTARPSLRFHTTDPQEKGSNTLQTKVQLSKKKNKKKQ